MDIVEKPWIDNYCRRSGDDDPPAENFKQTRQSARAPFDEFFVFTVR